MDKILANLGTVYTFIFKADGLFARAQYDPHLTIEDDGKLTDKNLLGHFLRNSSYLTNKVT
ncbi:MULTISPECIES: hypothetical protein [Francisella]|uniref:Uncharacterized protein n=1 Tax=Francisella opportunistica TaxID=2016517 RepID=A0A345JT64_9GAMM|nr:MULTISPECIES: hypothetical protein [Francisella]APC92303.1 hypothetical protein BBG19_1577 [Francisella sp. MA067296]AXH30510.1 hypothetical protein CGC43_07955 [Francisella opportunistica]AXH32151.1 hypothetical protein CGC44_07930 [Francisella opportunistica]AXH33800.1 hypothetical protein CGC45_07975 [Francisella opportunistica]